MRAKSMYPLGVGLTAAVSRVLVAVVIFGHCDGKAVHAKEIERNQSRLIGSSNPLKIDEPLYAPWTVMTMAPDGSWGAATDIPAGRAMYRALSNCKSKYKQRVGCGYQFTAVRAGWTLGFRCNQENIMVAERHFLEAVRRAAAREQQLKSLYPTRVTNCRLVVLIDPDGKISAMRPRKNLSQLK